MDIAPPPSGLRFQEFGDRLVVNFRPQRSWGEIAFLVFWLTAWTVGGGAAMAYLFDDFADRALVLVWLCGWAFGEVFAAHEIAWQLFGRERLLVGADELERRQELGRFARRKRWEAALVHDVRAVQVPHDAEERARKDFCLEIAYGEKTLHVGEGMGEREGEYVASLVLSRLRPFLRWREPVA